jgi:hypothetical protein
MTEAFADCEGVGLTEGKKPKPAGPPRTEVDEERTSAILHGTGNAKAPARAVDINPLVQVDARAPLRPLEKGSETPLHPTWQMSAAG